MKKPQPAKIFESPVRVTEIPPKKNLGTNSFSGGFVKRESKLTPLINFLTKIENANQWFEIADGGHTAVYGVKKRLEDQLPGVDVEVRTIEGLSHCYARLV